MQEPGASVRVGGEMARWWRERGEPLALGGLVLLAALMPVLLLLELLTVQVAARLMLALAWLAGLILLPRLARLLAAERRRVAVAGGVIAVGLGFILAIGSGEVTNAEPGATVEAQDGVLTFKAAPRISKQTFTSLLRRGAGAGTSPAAPYGDELYDIIVSYGLDPGVALAFFAKESQFCTTGVCRSLDMKNWGGNRRAVTAGMQVEVIQTKSGPFVRYASYQDGVRDWCNLITRYISRGLDTVDKAVPIYAPASDGNDPSAYINSIYRILAYWQGRNPRLAEPLEHVYADDLPLALMMETFQAAGLEFRSGWAFHKYALDEARAGRPLGSPLDESRVITVGSQRYAIQTFAMDTLYTPINPIEKETNWSDVRRMSVLMYPSPQPTATAPAPQNTPTPAPPSIRSGSSSPQP